MPKHLTADFLPIHTEYIILRRELIDYPTIRTRVENCVEGLRIEVEAFIAAMPSKRIEINKEWPLDWWQAFRERWFPAWWLSRYPVRHDRIYISQQLYSQVCPHLQKDPTSIHLDFLASEISPEEITHGELLSGEDIY